jgi:DNA-binding NarL/FixJ family response regulator
MTTQRQPSACSEFLTEREWLVIAAQYSLSHRELEVARGLVHGEEESQIAERLRLSIHTVHAYIRRLYHNADVHNHQQLVGAIFRVYVTQAGRDQRG